MNGHFSAKCPETATIEVNYSSPANIPRDAAYSIAML